MNLGFRLALWLLASMTHIQDGGSSDTAVPAPTSQALVVFTNANPYAAGFSLEVRPFVIGKGGKGGVAGESDAALRERERERERRERRERERERAAAPSQCGVPSRRPSRWLLPWCMRPGGGWCSVRADTDEGALAIGLVSCCLLLSLLHSFVFLNACVLIECLCFM